MTGAKAYVEYMPLSELRGALRNPKEHDIGTLWKSIERFGFADPPTVNERTGRLVEGHGRIEVLRQMKVAGEYEPRYVRNEGGEWYVPVVRGLSWDTDEEAEAYLIAHNRIGEVGAWRDEALTEVLSDLAAADALDGIGYDAEDVDRMLAAGSLDGVEFKEYDESVENDVKMIQCPACEHEFPA